METELQNAKVCSVGPLSKGDLRMRGCPFLVLSNSMLGYVNWDKGKSTLGDKRMPLGFIQAKTKAVDGSTDY